MNIAAVNSSINGRAIANEPFAAAEVKTQQQRGPVYYANSRNQTHMNNAEEYPSCRGRILAKRQEDKEQNAQHTISQHTYIIKAHQEKAHLLLHGKGIRCSNFASSSSLVYTSSGSSNFLVINI